MKREVGTKNAVIKLPSQRQDYTRRNPKLCLPEAARRKYQVNVSLNEGEVELLDVRRGALSRTAYLRGLLSPARLPRYAPIPAVNREAYSELARLASNLNQFSRHLNEKRAEFGQQAASAALVESLDGLELRLELAAEMVDALRRDLIGAGTSS